MKRNLRDGLLALFTWLTLLGSASATTFWGLTSDQHLVRFTSSAPGTILVNLAISGLPAGERMLAIQEVMGDGNGSGRDAAIGQIVGVSSSGHAYSLDRHTGGATLLPSTGPVVVPTGTFFGLTEAGDTLQLMSDTGQRIRIAKNSWSSVAGSIASHSIGNAFSWDPSSSQISGFRVNSASDTLVRIEVLSEGGPPGPFPGSLVENVTLLGPLGVDTSDQVAIDMDVHGGTLYAVLTVNGTQSLYTLDRTTGHATPIGPIGAPSILSLTVDSQARPLIAPINVADYALTEANRTVDMKVTRTGDDTVAADYALTTGGPWGGATLATVGQDYAFTPQSVHFEPGEVEKPFSFQLLDDNEREQDESITFRLAENVAQGMIGDVALRLVDDDNHAPVITLASPTSTAITVSTPTIMLSGTITDEDPGVVVGYDAHGAQYGDTPVFNVYLPQVTTTNNPWTFPDVPLNPGLNKFLIGATDIHGKQTITIVHIWRADIIDQTFVFAEGATGGFFHTDLLFANPNRVDVPLTVDFIREDGVSVPHAMTLPAASRTTLDVGSIAGLEATATAAVVHTNNFPIVVERTMTWDTQGYGASGEKGASALSTTWLFAEGSQGFFKTFLLLVNPQTTSNDVTVRFLREAGGPLTKTYTMSPHQRLTIDGAAIPELLNSSFGIDVTFQQPGVAERSMYFGDSPLWTGGHESAGAPAAATDWFLAEGATGPFFKTFLLLANPGNAPADVTMTYLPSTGVPVTRTKQVPANGRLTINIEFEDATLENAAVATHVTSSKPIVVERSQYWPSTPDQWYEAHNSFGQTAPATHWGLAEGRVGGPQAYQTYILLANPSPVQALVTMQFLRDDGGPAVTKRFAVPATSRLNVPVDSVNVPELTDTSFGVEIISSEPIMVERSMYSNAIGQIWAAGTNASATRLP